MSIDRNSGEFDHTEHGLADFGVESDATIDFRDDSGELETENSVERMLHTNAELFGALNGYWSQALRLQSELYQAYDLGAVADLQGSRAIRRALTSKGTSGKNFIFADVRQVAARLGHELASVQPEGILLEGSRPNPLFTESYANQVVSNVQGSSTSFPNAVFKEHNLDKEAIHEAALRPIVGMLPPFATAETFSLIGLIRIGESLTDAASCKYFAERLLDLAEFDAADQEFPGLLELLATEMAERGKDSLVHRALEAISHDPFERTTSFLTELFEEQSSNRESGRTKEVAVAYGVLKSVAALFEDVTEMSQEDFIKHYAQRVELWPAELKAALEQYTARNRVTFANSVKTALTPFARNGRITPQIDNKSMGNVSHRQVSLRSDKRVKTPQTRGGFQPVVEPEVEAAPEAISNFVILQRTGSLARNFVGQSVADLDDLLSRPVFQSYFKKYMHEQSLPEAIKRTIEYIAANPYDSYGSKVLEAGTYRLTTDQGATNVAAKKRRLRRFRPTSIPDVHGEIAVQTRVYYDVVNIEGQKTLAIYGIGIKQDVRSLDAIFKLGLKS